MQQVLLRKQYRTVLSRGYRKSNKKALSYRTLDTSKFRVNYVNVDCDVIRSLKLEAEKCTTILFNENQPPIQS